ncbi:MAG: shikimate dehydrogenase [Gammaproteobacteria bacterium]|nr:shikimate dehydrogenase [Gammaproteobacteria bacterium]MCH9744397.1 shikimate dehydrogenase [Gammaproteobacteria bacterium]
MDLYGVIGNPIEHSLSPQIHRQFAEQTDQDMRYIKIQATHENFRDTVTDFINQGGKGMNVTAPFKVSAFELANEHSEYAEQAQAANTLAFKKDQTIFSDNTDGIGLVQDLQHNHQYTLRQKNILILGAGGSTQCILGALLEQAPNKVTIANRTEAKAQQIANHFALKGLVESAALNKIPDMPYDLIINATSLSLEQSPTIPKSCVTTETWCYDLNYVETHTHFLTWANTRGAGHCINGLGMLVEQAAAAFYLWRGIYPVTNDILQTLKGSAHVS